MPSVTGMKSGGFYDRHSSIQYQSFEAFADWIDREMEVMSLPPEPAPFTIVDYGCSEGRNSIRAATRIAEGFRRRRPEQPLCVVHADLPTNDFNQLFRNLCQAGEDTYLHQGGAPRPNAFAFAAGRSYFTPVMPPGSVHVACSVLAVEWLDQLPAEVPDFVGYMGTRSEEAREAFVRQAARDLALFLELRALELAPGGKLLVVVPGGDGVQRCCDGLYDVLNDACLDLMAQGVIEPADHARLTMPVYFRDPGEMAAPFRDARLPLRLDRVEARLVPTPMIDDYRQGGSVSEFAAAYTAFLRAFSEPVALACLPSRAAVDALYAGVEQLLLREPERYFFRNIEVGLLATRLE